MTPQDHPHRLPDGRLPLRYDKGRAAFYIKARGEGVTRYTFSMIKFLRTHRPRKPDAEISALRKAQADKFLKDNPDYFKQLGRKGGKVTKDERQDQRR